MPTYTHVNVVCACRLIVSNGGVISVDDILLVSVFVYVLVIVVINVVDVIVIVCIGCY